jgi:hypothetical protein
MLSLGSDVTRSALRPRASQRTCAAALTSPERNGLIRTE